MRVLGGAVSSCAPSARVTSTRTPLPTARAVSASESGRRPDSASAALSASAMSPTESISVPSRSKMISSYATATGFALYLTDESCREALRDDERAAAQGHLHGG